MRFDWYAATIPQDPNVVILTLSSVLDAEVRSSKGMHGYTQGFEFVHPERGVIARCLSGGNRGAHPHAWASGDDTDKFVQVVRETFPDHEVTRFDSAEDFSSPGIFESLRSTLRNVAVEHRLKFPCIEDTLNPSEGRTQYIGSRKSPQFARLYEKGKQLQSMRMPNAATVINPSTGEIISSEDWTRLELVVRPEKTGRIIAATATPEQAWGFTDWTQHLAKDAFLLECERVFTRQHKYSEDDKALAWMISQYGNMLTRQAISKGGFDNLGLHIGDLIRDAK
jgi:hypothetical protein